MTRIASFTPRGLALMALCLALAGCGRRIDLVAVRGGTDYAGLRDQPDRDAGDWAAIEADVRAEDASWLASAGHEVRFRFHPCKSPGEYTETIPTIGGQAADAEAIRRAAAAAGGRAVRLTGYLQANAWQKIFHPDCMRLVTDGDGVESASVPLPHPLLFRFVPAEAGVRDLDDRLDKSNALPGPLISR